MLEFPDMVHPYTFLASLEKDVEKLPPLVKPSGVSWLDEPWRTELFDKFKTALSGALTNLPALNIKVALDGVFLETESGMLRFWTYELPGNEHEVQLGLRQAAALVGYALKTLTAPNENAKEIIKAYFGKEIEHWNSAKLQFEGIRNALTQKFIVVMKGEKAEDSLAYVHTRDDSQALYATKGTIKQDRYDKWIAMHFGGKIGFVSVKDRLFQSPSADRGGGLESTLPSAEHAMHVGVTLVHEISHLFAHEKTEDVKVNAIPARLLTDFPFQSEVAQKRKNTADCYGRILCKALAWTTPKESYKNADTLAFFALDVWLLQQKTSLEAILKLT